MHKSIQVRLSEEETARRILAAFLGRARREYGRGALITRPFSDDELAEGLAEATRHVLAGRLTVTQAAEVTFLAVAREHCDQPTARRAEASWRRRNRPPRQVSERARSVSRPVARSRSPRQRRHSTGTAASRTDPPGDDGDPDPDSDPDADPIEQAVQRLVATAPPLSAGQTQLLRRLIGGSR